MATADKNTVNVQLRVTLALAFVMTAFFILLLRLWYLQVLKGEFYRERSENNRIRTVFVAPPRGIITDRNGTVLVGNRPAFNIEFVTEDATRPNETLERVAELTGVSVEELKERLKRSAKRRRFEPKILLKDVSRDIVAKIAAHRHDLPGVVINVDPARNYLHGDLAAHVLGYIREINSEQLKDPLFAGYRTGDIVGHFGIENRWERLLQGQRGVQHVIVDAMGNRIGESSFQEEKPGNNLTLTVDYHAQKAADDALASRAGAVVAMNVNTGAILALASAPRFDPNIFSGEVTPAQWNDLVNGPGRKLSDRAFQGVFPPGSVFKIVTALAALSEGVSSPKERVFCPGFLPFGGRNFRCHKHSGHGSVGVYESLVESCDVYFYTVGTRLGVDRIHQYSTMLGLGEKTGIDLGDENAGLIPSSEWKRRAHRRVEDQKWYPGETLSVAIGQGAVTTTPLQLARMVAAVLNGGKILKPYLVQKAAATDGRILEEHTEIVPVRTVQLDQAAVELVKKGLVGVVNDPNGTGKRAKLPEQLGITVGGKTGTAQMVALGAGGNQPHLEDHAWFAGYAPADKPEIVVVALIENGGGGGANAAPVVQKVMEAYFTQGIPLPDPKAAKATSSSSAVSLPSATTAEQGSGD